MEYKPWMDYIRPEDMPNDDLKTIAESAGIRSALALIFLTPGLTVTIPRNAFTEVKKRYIITIDDYRIRRLTPLECFRLQGFPDEMVKVARDIGLADCRLYKMAGNAITVNVAEAVARKIADCEQRTEGLEKSKTADPFNASNQAAEVENGST